MSERNTKSLDEIIRRLKDRTTRNFIEDEMDLDEALSAAIEETGQEALLKFQLDFMAQVLKKIFEK